MTLFKPSLTSVFAMFALVALLLSCEPATAHQSAQGICIKEHSVTVTFAGDELVIHADGCDGQPHEWVISNKPQKHASLDTATFNL